MKNHKVRCDCGKGTDGHCVDPKSGRLSCQGCRRRAAYKNDPRTNKLLGVQVRIHPHTRK